MSTPLDLHMVPAGPLLDPAVDPAAHRAAVTLLVDGLRNHGLVYLHFPPAAHPHVAATLTTAFDQSTRFFASSLAEKTSAIAKHLPPGVTRGYLPTAAESGGNTPESKEAFSWSVDDLSPITPGPFEHPNVWPTGSTHSSLKSCFNSLFTLFHSTMRAVSIALDPLVPSYQLESFVTNGRSVSFARAFIYHPTDTALATATGSVEHTDWGFATILAQQPDSIALEVLHDSTWRSITGRADTLLFAAGDFLSLVSKGLFHSPRHRVVLTPRRRLSFAYFQYPPYGTSMPGTDGLGDVLGRMSLFMDQRPGADGRLLQTTREDGGSCSFGEFIVRKWEHVSRA